MTEEQILLGVGLTAVLEIIPEGTGTRYRATAIHTDEVGRAKHEEMGFYEGWGTVVTQLEEYMKSLGR